LVCQQSQAKEGKTRLNGEAKSDRYAPADQKIT